MKEKTKKAAFRELWIRIVVCIRMRAYVFISASCLLTRYQDRKPTNATKAEGRNTGNDVMGPWLANVRREGEGQKNNARVRIILK